jgi:hypothetical protein
MGKTRQWWIYSNMSRLYSEIVFCAFRSEWWELMDINKFWVEGESSWIQKFPLLFNARASILRLYAGTTGGQGKLKYFILPMISSQGNTINFNIIFFKLGKGIKENN